MQLGNRWRLGAFPSKGSLSVIAHHRNRDRIRDRDAPGRSGTAKDGCDDAVIASATDGDGGDASYDLGPG
jgi:hypothetical protein